MSQVLIAAGLVLAFCSCLMLVRGVATLITPRYATRVAELESHHRTELNDLFLPARDARIYAVSEALGPVVVAGVMLAVPPNSLVLALAGAVATFFVSRIIYSFIRQKRRDQFEQQLPSGLAALASCAKAGLTLEQSLRTTSEQMTGAFGEELGLLAKDLELKTPMIRALERAQKRIAIDAFSLVATALAIGHQHGGNLVETLESLERSVREILRLEQRVKTETAQIRFSAKIMAISPLVFLIIFYLIDPSSMGLLFTTLVGNLLLLVAGILVLVSYVLIQRLASPDL